MAKLTKSQLVEGLKLIGEKFTLPVDAQSSIDYIVDGFEENPRNVTIDDVKDSMKEVEVATGKKFLEVLKQAQDSVIADEEEKEAEKEEETEEKVDKRPLPKKADTKKKAPVENKDKPIVVPKVDGKKETKTEEVKETPKKNTTMKDKHPHQEYLASFPKTLHSEALKANLKLRDDLKTIGDIVKAYNNDEDLVIATYWTKKLLKQYATGYDPMGINPNRPKSFEHDLDLIEMTFANDLVVTGCSLYSYVPQILLPQDFEIDEETGMRYANGCEFQIYEVVEGEEK